MDRSLLDRLNQAKRVKEEEKKDDFPEWKVWCYFLQVCWAVDYLNWK